MTRNEIKESIDMQCYQTIAATTLVSRIIDSLQGAEQCLHPAAVADWMETRGLDVEDVLGADREILKAQVAALLDRDSRYRLKRAA